MLFDNANWSDGLAPGEAPSWLVLRAPRDIREADGVLVGWHLHIDADNRNLVYRLVSYPASTDTYEAVRTDR